MRENRFIIDVDDLEFHDSGTVGKASPSDPLWRQLHRIADKAEPALRKKILAAIAATVENVNEAALERALSRGDAAAALKAINWDGNGDAQLRAAYQVVLADVYGDAGEATAGNLSRSLDVPASFNLAHPRAEAWAEAMAATRVKDVSDATVDALRSVMVRGWREGIHPRDLARIIRGTKDPETGQYKQSLIGLTERQAQAVWNYRARLEEDENRPTGRREEERIDRMVERYRDKLVLHRAETISRTEMIAAANEGQQELWRQAKENGWLRGNEQREWIATPSSDGRTCAACLGMDGQRRGLDEEFIDETGEFDPVLVPPLHVQCFLPGTIINGAIVSGLKSEYSGPAVELKSSKGDRLCVTANHPILTPQGWVPASSISEGDYVFCYDGIAESTFSIRRGHNEHGPAAVEEIFKALSARGCTTYQVGALDLHGDAVFTDGYVNIVGTDLEVRGCKNSVVLKSGNQLDDVLPNSDKLAMYGSGMLDLRGDRFGLTSGSSPSSTKLPLNEGAVCLERPPFQVFRFGLPAKYDALVSEHATKSIATHTGFIADLLERGTGEITQNKIVGVRKFYFSGHVYDLQSVNGWIISQNIVSSNCRCATGLVAPKQEEEE